MLKTNTSLYISALTLIVIWGTAFTLIGYTVDYISPAWMVAARTLIASVFLVVYALMRGHKIPPLKDERWIWYSVMGLVGMAAPFYFTARGQIHVDSGLTSIFVGFMPLLTILMAHFFIKEERLTFKKTLGFFIGFVGIIILFLPSPFKLGLIENWQSQGLIILTAICYALLSIIAKRAPDTPPSVGAAMMIISAAIMSLIWALYTGVPTEMPPVSSMAALFALAIGATGFAQILYLQVIDVKGPSFVAKLNYLVPVCSLIAGITFLDEVFSMRAVIAMCIIFIGLLIARQDGKT